jgi:predicted lipoprotein with Yx(FWY)xxD motif
MNRCSKLLAVCSLAGSVLASLSGAPAASAAGVTVSSRPTAEGRVLVGASGLSLYIFTGDSSSATACTSAACQKFWPPLLAPGGPVSAGPGVNAKELAVATRPGVGRQVTYYGHPLYYFLADKGAGQTHGEDVTSFGGAWYLVSTAGHPAPRRAEVRIEPTAEGLSLGTLTAFGAVRTLYTLSSETAGSTTCVSACQAFWPPLLSSGPALPGAGVDKSLLGLLRLPDGTFQVTYGGHRLRLFTKDLEATAPSSTTYGEGVMAQPLDGVWYTVSPSGFPNPGAAHVLAKPSGAGNILVLQGAGGAVATVYGFTGKNCTGECAVAWPPVLSTEPPVAGTGVNAGDLGVVQRPDGSYQVTYKGHPLYLFFKALSKSLAGAGIKAFGGTFEAVSSNGALVSSVPKAPATTTTASTTTTTAAPPPPPSSTTPTTTPTTTSGYGGY